MPKVAAFLILVGLTVTNAIYNTRNDVVRPHSVGSVHLWRIGRKPALLPKLYTFPAASEPAFKVNPLLWDLKKPYSKLPNGHKKPPKYVKHTAVGKLKSSWKADAGKNCCGNEWSLLADKEAARKPLEPVYGVRVFGYAFVKPVEERIEDDLKYDFRTKTHSL